MADLAVRPEVLFLIAVAGFVTYLTRIGGYLIVSRFSRIHPRVEAALNAVPAAVITAIVAPPILTSGGAEWITALVVAIACLRLPPFASLLIGMACLMTARTIGL